MDKSIYEILSRFADGVLGGFCFGIAFSIIAVVSVLDLSLGAESIILLMGITVLGVIICAWGIHKALKLQAKLRTSQ